MRNFLSSVSFGLFLFMMGCCASPVKVLVPEPVPHQVYRDDQIERVKRLKNITVALMGESNEHQVISCSAMWVGKGLLLTASHCVEKNKVFSYETIDEKDNILHLAIVKVKDDNNDLALLLVDPSTEPLHDNIALNQEVIESGEEVHIVGHTMGYGWTYSKGYVAAVRKNMLGPLDYPVEKVVQISAPVWKGNSGGGAFDSAGHFVGLCSWVATNGPFLSFFIHRDVVLKFLQKNEVI